MDGIDFIVVLHDKWSDKAKNSSTTELKKMHGEYLDYCLTSGLNPEREENLIDFIEKRKYDEKPIATPHDIYRVAQVQMLVELVGLKKNSDFFRDFVEIINGRTDDESIFKAVLDTTHTYLDHYENDESINYKLRYHKVKWDPSAG